MRVCVLALLAQIYTVRTDLREHIFVCFCFVFVFVVGVAGGDDGGSADAVPIRTDPVKEEPQRSTITSKTKAEFRRHVFLFLILFHFAVAVAVKLEIRLFFQYLDREWEGYIVFRRNVPLSLLLRDLWVEINAKINDSKYQMKRIKQQQQ